jgi:hypothetical protein
MSRSRPALFLVVAGVGFLTLAASGGERPAAETVLEPPPERAFDWTVGEWTGVRRDGADGSEAPMTMRVAPILGGAGLIRELEVRHGGGVYRGLSVVAFEREAGRWVEQYVNDVHGRFVRLEGELEDGGARSVWRSVAPERRRESRLVSERLGPDRWRRTQSVSEDGGATWRVLWSDELERKSPAGPGSPG